MAHCNHNWKSYQGFTDSFYYCETCDAKSATEPVQCPLVESQQDDDLQLTFYGFDHLPHEVAMDLRLPIGKMNDVKN